jgi:hypothetical protein
MPQELHVVGSEQRVAQLPLKQSCVAALQPLVQVPVPSHWPQATVVQVVPVALLG